MSRRLTTEELVQIKLLKETFAEIHGELEDMPDSEVREIKYRVGLCWARCNALLVRYGAYEPLDRPAPPNDDIPF